MIIDKNKREYCPRCNEMRSFQSIRIELSKSNKRLLKGNCGKCNKIKMLPICMWENLAQNNTHITDYDNNGKYKYE